MRGADANATSFPVYVRCKYTRPWVNTISVSHVNSVPGKWRVDGFFHIKHLGLTPQKWRVISHEMSSPFWDILLCFWSPAESTTPKLYKSVVVVENHLLQFIVNNKSNTELPRTSHT